MAAKRVDPMKAKAAKQKKIAIGGAVVLVALLAVQGPKTLKMLQGPQPVTPPAAATPTTPDPAVPPATAAGAAPAGAPAAEAAPTAAADLASVPDSDQAPVVDEGQLATFERFSSKDPFAQQAKPVAAAKPAAPKPEETKPVTEPSDGSSAGAGATDGGFTAGGGTPPAATPLAAATSIAVNGVAEDVALEAVFPVAQPTFVLVSIAKDGKSAQIGIAGGAYASGGETLKLGLGKKLTLQNTADGSRFELELLALQGFPLPKKKG
jgi:hypothetical protein